MKRLYVLSVVCFIMFCVVGVTIGAAENPVGITDDGTLILKTVRHLKGLVLVDTVANDSIAVSSAQGAGTYASVAPNKKHVCYKLIKQKQNGARTHTPMLFDIAAGEAIPLAEE